MKTKPIFLKSVLTFLTVFSVVCGIVIPKLLLERKYGKQQGIIKSVPESYYTASDTAMAKKSSELLSPLEKMKLICGTWESTWADADYSDAILSESGAVYLAKQQLSVLYENNCYPSSIISDYNNWYSWSTKLYSYTDTTFHTYTCCLWAITFTRFDNEMSHTVYMTEDGILLAAFVNTTKPDGILSVTTDSVRQIFCDDKIRLEAYAYETPAPSSFAERFSSVYGSVLPEINLTGIHDVKTTQVSLSRGSLDIEEYTIYQFETNTGYCFGVMPAP